MRIETPLDSISDWEPVGTIQIDQRLSVSDTSYFYDKPLVVALEAGEYLTSVHYIKSNEHKHIARVRVAFPDTLVSIGSEIGCIVVDFSQIGICDRDAVELAFNTLGDQGMSLYFDQLNVISLVDVVNLPDSIKMFIVRPGYGDGTYPVHELLGSDGTRKGIEIHCLPELV